MKMKRGFTLIELMVSVSIFLIIMTISMGALLGVFAANRKFEALKTVMDNLNLSVESMSREMRFGKNYHCIPPSDELSLTVPENCPGGASGVSFLAEDGVTQIVYKQNGTEIDKSTDGGATFIPVTAPEITITSLTFYVLGAVPSDTLQPKTLIKISGFAGTTVAARTTFTLQTLVSQRTLDI
jgi:prepilin-type N-terminal cleavage/methylation domain-containing protein